MHVAVVSLQCHGPVYLSCIVESCLAVKLIRFYVCVYGGGVVFLNLQIPKKFYPEEGNESLCGEVSGRMALTLSMAGPQPGMWPFSK